VLNSQTHYAITNNWFHVFLMPSQDFHRYKAKLKQLLYSKTKPVQHNNVTYMEGKKQSINIKTNKSVYCYNELTFCSRHRRPSSLEQSTSAIFISDTCANV